MRRRGGNAGYTAIEMLIASFLGLIIVFALGRLILTNQRSWEWGRDKAVLQQNSTEALEWMARSIRAAGSLSTSSATSFSTHDSSGVLIHTYQLTGGGDPRIQEDGVNLVDRRCTQFNVVPDSDTTSLSLTLELEDNAGNLVLEMTRARLRNRIFEF
ncbi:MAG: hypothetical protein KJ970_17120 [Candidatus Eisenbacteria bacterium]|uniref:Prepilin-type N-terminal cleavage/methylation domain-containing protein n=1 Tax=Eiseniibacteriota bacterium TaxID=2212470 RepID=A0A948RZV7_UNCEI|nr:hypothetical protein [Candidatus Eisenbacteria bacterium]MBU1950624.1 hypothetical protein [Candidatus Eisenbacteria bacterium]MBU2692639.1 hypothetical protein [Candidatus Eisenbacteria bacterium]